MSQSIKRADSIIEITLTGTVEERDIETLEQQVNDALAATEKLGVLIDVTGWSDITEEAIREDIGFEMGMLGKLGQIGNVAIVSDKQWAGALVHLVGPWIPGLNAKCFKSDQMVAARAYAATASKGKTQPAEGPGFKIIQSDNGLIIFEIDGKIRDEGLDEMMDEFNNAMKGHDKVRLIADMKNFAWFEPSVLTHEGLMAFKLDAAKKVSRYAIVNAPNWVKPMANMGEFFFSGLDIEFFDNLKDAKKWATA